jgi:hypothetical protein
MINIDSNFAGFFLHLGAHWFLQSQPLYSLLQSDSLDTVPVGIPDETSPTVRFKWDNQHEALQTVLAHKKTSANVSWD